MSNNAASPRLSDQAWIDAALKKLATGNIDDVRIEALARDLGVTKGSFYWHFKNRKVLLERMLDSWMEKATLAVANRIHQRSHGWADELEQLLTLPARTPPTKLAVETELAIRSWARFDPRVAEKVVEIDQIRAESFRVIFRELGFTQEQAAHRAAIAQSFMLGDSLLAFEQDVSRRIGYAKSCVKLLLGPEARQAG